MIFSLSDKISFPPPHFATKDGLLAVGGDLSIKRLLTAYRMGIFPWFVQDEPILWWSPDPRLVLYPSELKISKSLEKTIKKEKYSITFDIDFKTVITSCAKIRSPNRKDTWITDNMINAYIDLHEAGYAHSVESWNDGEIVGGLYGVSLGACFFGESMFTRKSDASKVAFVKLVKHLSSINFAMIDCQVTTRHLINFGAREIPRNFFLSELEDAMKNQTLRGRWQIP